MSDAFDPYYSWLGIPPAQQPADYYRLLGINRFEGNQEVIANAAERQIRHIETFKTGLHAKEAEKLLNKLATAKACLSDIGKKQVYDRAMSGTVAAEESPPVASDSTKAHSPKVATSRSRPRTRNPLVGLAKIVLGGIAGLVIGMAILWYGFGMDVLGVMQPPRDVTANPAAEKKATVPESTSRSQTPPVAIEPTLEVGKQAAKPLAVQPSLESHEVPSPPPQSKSDPGAAVDESTKNSVADGTLASTPVSFRDVVQKLLGTWEVTYTNRTRNRRTIGTDGPLTSANGDILIDFDTVIERLSLVGDKLFVEHFNPKSTYPKGFPYAIGIGKRIDVPAKSDSEEAMPVAVDLLSLVQLPRDNLRGPDHDIAISSAEASGTTPARAVVPAVAVLASAEATVRSVFADEYVSSKTPAEKSELAAKLLQIGLDTTDDTASRFVTLRSARNVAVEGGHVDLAFRAVDAMNESFEMDTLAEQARLAEDLTKASLNEEETAKLKQWVVELREQAFDRDRYPVAVSLNALSRGLGKATDKQWREATDRWTKRIEAGSAAFEIVQEALKTLDSSPENAAANLTIGRYRCLLKSEWQIGLPYLAKGDDEKLRAIAEREMASSDPTPNETLALADSWWDLAAELDGIEQPQVQMRAAQLYESALPNLSGLSAAKADKRVRELRALGIDSNAVPPELPHRGPAPTEDASKDDFKVMSNSIGMKLVLIPAGEFMMGSGSSAEKLEALFDTPPSVFSAEYPRHQVRISKAFYAGKYEVTVEQFRQFVEATGYQTYNEVHPEGGIVYDRKQKKPIRVKGVSWRNPGFEQTDAHPVVSVTWDDAVAFCDWLSEKEGARYRLPTEAEWEYVARAATDTIYYSGNSIEDLRGCCNAASLEVPVLSSDGVPLVSRVPWNDGFSNTSPVGSFRPNGFGLYDITGNVWEWCRDSLREYLPKSISVDPIGPVSGETRAVRGGSHADAAFNQRVARRAAPPRNRGNLNFGFRVVRELDITP